MNPQVPAPVTSKNLPLAPSVRLRVSNEIVSVHTEGRRAVVAWCADEQTVHVGLATRIYAAFKAASKDIGCPDRYRFTRGCKYQGQGGDHFEKAVHLFGAGPYRFDRIVGVFSRL